MRNYVAAMAALAAISTAMAPASADEGGASVWLPGQFASWAASQSDPGFSLETIFYTRRASATAGMTFSRGGGLLAGVDISEQYVFLTPGYTFADPVLSGQLYLGLTFSAGRNGTSVWGVLTGPRGNSVSAGAWDEASGVSDLYPFASLKWQQGPHNFMAYAMGSAPVGAYDPNRYAGVGLGHWALDGGLGYTFESSGGFEFSVVGGLTYNFVNPVTQYQSGVDSHFDFGASYSLTERLYIGAVGYFYNQLGSDSGVGVAAGGFRSRIAAAGPQIGWSFEVGNTTIDLSARAYKEFAAENRPEGWNAFLVVSLARPKRTRQE